MTMITRNITDNLEISKGNVKGHSFISRFGRGTVGVNNTDIRTENANVVYPTVPVQLRVNSTDANDTSNGTGARSVNILGLDQNWEIVTETVTMNGANPVLTTNLFRRINRVTVGSVGSTGATVGTINVVTNEGTPKQMARISPLENEATFAFFTVPANHTAFLQRALIQNGSNDISEISLMVRSNPEDPTSPFIAFHRYQLFQFAIEVDWDNFIKFSEKSDIKFAGRCLTAASTDVVSASFTLLLVDNDNLTRF